MADIRTEVVTWARWCVTNKYLFTYLESRPFPLYQPTPLHHIANDCSATSVLVLWLAGAPEPFQFAYEGWGNTESFGALEHVSDPLPGDFVVYGLGLPMNVQHMATVLESGSDPLTMSHGGPAEPRLVNAIEGCPVAAEGRITYVRCLPVVTPPAPPPPPPEVPEMAVITTNPNNKGKVVLDPNTGSYYGIANTAVYTYYINTLKVPEVAAPTKDVFSHFEQKGTI